MIVDTSVARNFAILDWTLELAVLCAGTIVVAHGVLGIADEETGEIDDVRKAFFRESQELAGTAAGSRATAAVVGLDRLIQQRGRIVDVATPSPSELALAVRLQDPNERDWLKSLGVAARRLDAGEAVSIAIATSRGMEFATDDDDGRAAYVGLTGQRHYWTRDLAKDAVSADLLTEGQARYGYELLVEHYRFWGPPW